MSSLNLNNLIGSDDLKRRDGILQNAFDAWPSSTSSTSPMKSPNPLLAKLNSSANKKQGSPSPDANREKSSNSDGEIIECDMKDISLVYPVLQPLKLIDADANANVTANNANNSTNTNDAANSTSNPALKGNKFVAWNNNTGTINFTFYGNDPGSTFLSSEWGYAHLPIKDLIIESNNNSLNGLQPEVVVWCPVTLRELPKIDANISHYDAAPARISSRESRNLLDEDEVSQDCQVLLRVQLDIRYKIIIGYI